MVTKSLNPSPSDREVIYGRPNQIKLTLVPKIVDHCSRKLTSRCLFVKSKCKSDKMINMSG